MNAKQIAKTAADKYNQVAARFMGFLGFIGGLDTTDTTEGAVSFIPADNVFQAPLAMVEVLADGKRELAVMPAELFKREIEQGTMDERESATSEMQDEIEYVPGTVWDEDGPTVGLVACKLGTTVTKKAHARKAWVTIRPSKNESATYGIKWVVSMVVKGSKAKRIGARIN